MTKNQIMLEHIVVTFFEGAISYLTINQTNLTGISKTAAIGACAFGLSAVYNLLRQSNPTIADDIQQAASPLSANWQPPQTDIPLNGVEQLTQPGTTVSPDPTGEPTTTPPVPPAPTV